MEIPQKKEWLTKQRIAALGLVLIIVMITSASLIAFGSFSKHQIEVHPDQIVKIDRGVFEKTVRGYGELVPSDKRVLVTKVSGLVVKKDTVAGTHVNSESTVIELSNPTVEKEYELAEIDFKVAQADYQNRRAELIEKELSLRNEVKLLEAALDAQLSQYEAKKSLVEKSQIISAIELQKEEMLVEQAKLKHQLATEKLNNFLALKESRESAIGLYRESARRKLDIKKGELSALTVKAGSSGILQEFDDEVDIGEWLERGTIVGVVASQSKLSAELNINARDAAELEQGMKVLLNFRQGPISAEIVSISPNVRNGQVSFTALNLEPLPSTARPNLDVSGDVIVQRTIDGLIVPVPPHYSGGETVKLYVESGSKFYLADLPVLSRSATKLLLDAQQFEGKRTLLINPKEYNYINYLEVSE